MKQYNVENIANFVYYGENLNASYNQAHWLVGTPYYLFEENSPLTGLNWCDKN